MCSSKRKKYCIEGVNSIKFHLKHKIFAFFIILFLLVFVYIKYLATPIVVANTETQIRNYATKSINFAVAETMNQNIKYSDFITVFKDSNNDISMVEANSIKINLLAKTLSKVVMSNFLELSKSPIKIALGSFSGISILSGYGPKIAYDVNPFGEVYSSFSSEFESAGINQTNHKIYLNVQIKVNVVMPFRKIVVNSSSDVLLCESLIVGKIPNVFLSGESSKDMLSLSVEKF